MHGMTDIDKIHKGNVTNVHNAISATASTSTKVKCKGYNALLVKVTIAGGTWKIDAQGANTEQGTCVDIYDNYDNQLTTGNLTASRMRLFVGVPDWVQLVATEVVNGGTCTVDAQPINI